MIDLKIDGKTTKLSANFGFYKNIVGIDKSEINKKFDSFIVGMLDADLDTLLDFYAALTDYKLSKDEIVEQLEEAKAFDDIDKEFDEDIQLLCDSGFFKLKIIQWHKTQQDMLKAYKNVTKEISKEISKGKSETRSAKELEQMQEQKVEAQAGLESMKVMLESREKALKKHKII